MAKKENTAIIKAEKKEINIKKDIDLQSLLNEAIKGNLPVDSLQKLLDMRTQLKAEYAKEQFNISLSNFQADCPIIKKDKIVYERDKQTKEILKDKNGNLLIRYAFAPLDSIIEQVKEILQKHGFSYTFKSRQTEKTFTSILEIRHIAGHCEISEFEVPIDFGAFMNSIQRIGNSSTYADRYNFKKGFGILTADYDDDANAIDENEHEEKQESTFQKFTEKTNEKIEIVNDFNSQKAQKELADKSEKVIDAMTIDEKKYFSQVLGAKSILKIDYNNAIKGLILIQKRIAEKNVPKQNADLFLSKEEIGGRYE